MAQYRILIDPDVGELRSRDPATLLYFVLRSCFSCSLPLHVAGCIGTGPPSNWRTSHFDTSLACFVAR
jgi:hypothetical protein